MLKINRRSLLAATSALLIILAATASIYSAAVPAVDFSLRSIEGQQISSEKLRGNVVVLAFGASWLPLSREQAQGVQELADEYRDRNVKVFWVSTDSDSPKSKNYATDDQLRAFAQKNGLKVTVLRDPNGAVSKQLGADQLPAVIILDREGKISGTPIGGLDPKVKLLDQLSGRMKNLL